ncbi:MAG: MaoC family dehydratase [Alphaproteobacteria bacterium]
MVKIVKPAELDALIGTEIGVSDWITVEQERINQFADVTEDHQYIHIDPVKAKDSPFGTTIAHGFLTLSLLSKFSEGAAIAIEGVHTGINYGFDKMRFLAPVPAGSKVRARFVLGKAIEKKPGQFLLTYNITVEIEGNETPALIAEWLGMQVVG